MHERLIVDDLAAQCPHARVSRYVDLPALIIKANPFTEGRTQWTGILRDILPECGIVVQNATVEPEQGRANRHVLDNRVEAVLQHLSALTQPVFSRGRFIAQSRQFQIMCDTTQQITISERPDQYIIRTGLDRLSANFFAGISGEHHDGKCARYGPCVQFRYQFEAIKLRQGEFA